MKSFMIGGMFRILKNESAFIKVFLAYAVLGAYLSYPLIKSVWHFSTYRDLPRDEKRITLFGTDAKAYEEIIASSPENATIIALMPDKLYWGKMHYFLYPRRITFTGNPNELPDLISQQQYDYLLLYYPVKTEWFGAIKGNAFAVDHDWSPENLYTQIKNALGEDRVGSFEDFKVTITSGSGNYLVRLKS